jgi:hypothetical protein
VFLLALANFEDPEARKQSRIEPLGYIKHGALSPMSSLTFLAVPSRGKRLTGRSEKDEKDFEALSSIKVSQPHWCLRVVVHTTLVFSFSPFDFYV